LQWLVLIIILLIVDVIGAPIMILAFLTRNRKLVRSYSRRTKSVVGNCFAQLEMLLAVFVPIADRSCAAAMRISRPNSASCSVSSRLATSAWIGLRLACFFSRFPEVYTGNGLAFGWEAITLMRRTAIVILDGE
jgi:hypothetical protein